MRFPAFRYRGKARRSDPSVFASPVPTDVMSSGAHGEMFKYCCQFYMRGVEVPTFDFRAAN